MKVRDINIYPFEKYFSLSIILFTMTQIIGSFKLINLNYGALNLLFACFPFVVCLFKYKIVLEKKNFIIFGLLLLIKIASFLTNSLELAKGDILIELYYLLSFFLCSFSTLFVIIPNFSNTNYKFNSFPKLFLISSIIFCLYNIFAYDISFQRIFNSTNSYEFLYSSFFANRNHFGKMLFVSNILLIYLYENKMLKNKYFFSALLIFINLNLILTFSRAGIFCTAIFYILLFLKNRKMKLFLISIITTFVFLYYFSPTFSGFLETFIFRKSTGLSGRDNIWKHSIDIFVRNPLFGLGNTNSSNLIYSLTNNYYFHNSFIKILCSEGIISLFLWILVLINIYKGLLRKSVYNRTYIVSTLISILLYSFVEEYIFFGTGFINYWYSFVLFLFLPLLCAHDNTMVKKREV